MATISFSISLKSHQEVRLFEFSTVPFSQNVILVLSSFSAVADVQRASGRIVMARFVMSRLTQLAQLLGERISIFKIIN